MNKILSFAITILLLLTESTLLLLFTGCASVKDHSQSDTQNQTDNSAQTTTQVTTQNTYEEPPPAPELDEYSKGLSFVFDEHTGTYTLSGRGTCKDDNIIVPPTYRNTPITRVGTKAFYEDIPLKSISLPDTVKEIGTKAFSGCLNLQRLTFPKSITKIEAEAFHYSGLTELTLTSDSEIIIEPYAFSDCYSLRTVTLDTPISHINENVFHSSGLYTVNLPDELKTIGNCAFYFTMLREIALPNGLTYIGEEAFTMCRELTEIVIPDTVTHIGKKAFSSCHKLSSVTLPKDLKVITEGMLYGCAAMKTIVLPDSITAIEKHAFGACNGLESIVLPKGVKEIGEDAFNGTFLMTDITLPEGLTTIGKRALMSIRVPTLLIPKSVTSIGAGAFHPDTTVIISEDNPVFSIIGNCLIQGDTIVMGFPNCVIPDDSSITTIGEDAFRWSDISISSLPQNIKYIHKNAFTGCDKITEMILHEGIEVCDGAFQYCNRLTSITLPKSLTALPGSELMECYALKTITFNGSEDEWKALLKDNKLWTYAEVVFLNK